MGVNLSNILYFHRVIRDRFRWGVNFVIPVLGILINLGLLYEAFLKPMLDSDTAGGHSVLIFSVGLMALWVACTLAVKRFMPRRLQGEPPISVR
jgi:hypothetical protein